MTKHERLIRRAKKLLMVSPTTYKAAHRSIKKWNDQEIETKAKRVELIARHVIVLTALASVMF